MVKMIGHLHRDEQLYDFVTCHIRACFSTNTGVRCFGLRVSGMTLKV
jgi:hypothetical protein